MMTPGEWLANRPDGGDLRTWAVNVQSPEGGISALADRLAAEMTTAWYQGLRPEVEAFLERLPDQRAEAGAVVRLILHEVSLRRDFGVTIDRAAILGRFPDWEVELRARLGSDPPSWGESETPEFPEAGDELAGFRLTVELGRGGMGRVFLALQPALADRPVVVKITPLRGNEHRSLARLQHTHVVPLLSAQDLPERGLMVICLPYLGGTTLSQILVALVDLPPARRSGRDLLEALDRACAAAPVPVTAEGPARAFLTAETYERSVCWLAYCLAQGLQHAHRRDLVHLDVKPANVLIAADGMPFLLDFHLARPPVAAGTRDPKWQGGTPGHMAPEQHAAIVAEWTGLPAPVTVDARADVYALGVLLYEALAGKSPHGEKLASRLRQANPKVGVGLSDVVARCLETEPSRRYPDAAELAEDLHRFLDDRALMGVPNRSLTERLSRWRRRRPLALVRAGAISTAVLGLIAVGLAVWVGARQRLADASVELTQGRRHLDARAYPDADRSFEHGLDLLKPGPISYRAFPGAVVIESGLIEGLRVSQRAQLAEELKLLVDRVRTLYAEDAQAPESVRGLERRLAKVWSARATIQARVNQGGDPSTREQVRCDLLDLAVLWVDLRVRTADESTRAEVRRAAIHTLDEAEADFGPSPVLEHERTTHASALGLTVPARAAEMPPRTAWEFYALGRSLLQAGDLEPAAEALDRAVRMKPRDLWAQFSRGRCALRRSRFAEAVDAFGACVALAPDVSAGYQNRGLAYARLGLAGPAELDFQAARKLDAARKPAAR